MSERSIGKVISVDSFRAYIRLDDDLKSLYKSGYEDIFEVARINSYVIIPIGSDRIVAMVTSVRAIDETELGKNTEAIFLTKSARYLVATMIGTIENSGKYIQGVYNYPILDNPVWYVTSQDLDSIFDQKKNSEEINFEDDFYLPIGTSPSFSDYKIKINPDKFFGKHAAILGNTGSGKSCTVASIIQSMFDFNYNGKKLKNAHIIIFDTNGEYKQAFQGTKENPYKNLELVNPFHIDKNGMKVPFWFMNFADFDYLFEPTSGTQAPIFKRALGLAKNQTVASVKKLIPQAFLSKLESISSACDANDFKIKNLIWDDIESFGVELKALDTDFDKNGLLDALRALCEAKKALSKPNKYVEGYLSTAVLTTCSQAVRKQLSLYNASVRDFEVAEERNIDLPLFFDFNKLLQQFFDEAICEQESSNSKLREYVSTLRLRLQSYLGDERISQPLLLTQTEKITSALAKFISFILGDFCKVYKTEHTDIYTDFYKDQLDKEEIEKLVADKPSQVTIIDMSLLPYEVLETITGLIGRLILDFVSRFPEIDRGKLPMVIALEEAQNYIPEKNRDDRESIAKKVFERIAREGRKYGISLLVSSQRPSELSKTVLSQCNSFIIHRLQNPEDQKYVRQLVSAANEDILQQLPILPQQHVVIMGDAVRTPVQARMNTATPRPNSNNPKFIENWTMELPKDFPNYEKIAEAWEKGEKYKPTEPDVEQKE
ncbi:ATP-binding protein [Labilibaculum sp.]|uniref:ATP-binding protein n=1 Tax=Labilibaculum sp. TaxID=2060723 RepID=UPI003562D9B7